MIRLAWGIGGSGTEHFTEFSIATLGSVVITTGRTTPVALSYRKSERITVEMCYGRTSRFREESTDLRSLTGEIL
ncbi:MAG: hypothetical protein ACKO8I_00780, partial [Cyanobacteriota bacterium]